MKASRKVFAVLTVALPAMLIASMARAEDGSRGSDQSSMCYSSERINKEAEYCRSKGGDPQKVGNSSNGQDCITGVKCVMSTTIPAPQPPTPPASVVCKRTVEKNFFIFSCEDGKSFRINMNAQGNGDDHPMPPMPPAPIPPVTSRCDELEMKLKVLRSQSDKPSKEVAERIMELQKKLEECRGNSSSASSSTASTPASDRCREVKQMLADLRVKMQANPGNTELETMYKNYAEKLKACEGVKPNAMDTDMVLPEWSSNASSSISSVSTRPANIKPRSDSCQRITKNVDGRKCTIMTCRGGRELPNTLSCGQ